MTAMRRFTYTTISILLLAGIATGCTKNFEKYNTDPYSTQTQDPSILIPSMIDALMFVQQNNSQMIDQMVGSLGGYFAISNRFGGQNFDTFNASDDWNAGPYSTPFLAIYSNYFKIEKNTNGKGHYFALAKVIRAAAMARVADLYGPIPYSKVMDGMMYVEYDSNEDVYKNILKDLEDGATELYEFYQEYPTINPLGSRDLIYGGNYSLWARFANSVALRIAVRTGNAEAVAAACAHPAGLIKDNSQNAMMSTGMQINPYNLASASWGDLRVNASITDYMNGYDDPRMPYYFQPMTFEGYDNVYMGMRTGEASFEKSDVAGYSIPNFTSSSPLPVFTASETLFLLAEASLKGWISENTAECYNNGIKLSMEQYGISSSQYEKYLSDNESKPADHAKDPRGEKYNYDRKTEVTVAWDNGADDETKLEKIITQKWIAMYPMGMEAWAEFRRTGYPELNPAMDNLSNGVISDNARGMRRLRYPYTEKNLNLANYNTAVSMLGGADNESTDLFWTKKAN